MVNSVRFYRSMIDKGILYGVEKVVHFDNANTYDSK